MQNNRPEDHPPALTDAFIKAALPDGLSFDDLLAQPQRVLQNGEEALSHALRKNFLTASGIAYLYEQGIDIHMVDKFGTNALFDAISYDRDDLFDVLMDQGGITHINQMQATRLDKKSLLHAAVMRGNMRIAEKLIAAGADINAIDADSMSPLARAIATCSESMVNLLLKAGADVVKYERITGIKLLRLMHPMILASAANGPEDRMILSLLAHGANPDTDNTHGTPLIAHYAERNRTDVVAAMAQLATPLNGFGPGTNSLTPLCHAVTHSNSDMIDALIAAGADPNATTPYADLPLMYALRKNDLRLCEQLIAGGADLNAGRQNGLSLLCQVILGNADLKVVEYLLASGANPNLISFAQDGRARPLHIAANQQRLDCIELLLNHGANPLLPDLTGTMPLEYAMKRLGPGHPVTDRLRRASMDASQGQDAGSSPVKKQKPDNGGIAP